MKVKKNEHWIAEIQMFPGDEMIQRIIWIYGVTKEGDVGFVLIGDDAIYYCSQVEWFNPIEKVRVNE